MSDADATVDLLVFGGGMAGISAAAKAASDGASVILVEKGPAIGGSAIYAGFIWTAPTVEVMREVNPDADPELSARRRRGIRRGSRLGPLARRLGRRAGDGAGLRPRERRRIWPTICSPASGWCESAAKCWWGARRSDSCSSTGPWSGLRSRTQLGEPRVIRARSTLLATGGFGGDPALRDRAHPPAGK